MSALPVSPLSAPISPVAPIVTPASISVITASGSSASGSGKSAATTSSTTLTAGASTVPASFTAALPGSSASSVSFQRRIATVAGSSASGSRIQPNLPSTSAQHDIAEARQAIDASIANLLDTQLQDRATLMHENMRSIAGQQRDLSRAVAGLRKANDGLTRLVHEFTGSYKEMGHVQNWAEIQYQNISALEETMRLVRERRAREEQREERRRLREERRRQRLGNDGECAAGEGRAREHDGDQYDDDDEDDDDDGSWSSSGSYSGSYTGSYTGSSRSHSRSKSDTGDGEAILASVPVALAGTTCNNAAIEVDRVEVVKAENEADGHLGAKGKATEATVIIGQTKGTGQEAAHSLMTVKSSPSANTVEREVNNAGSLAESSPNLDQGKEKDTEIAKKEELPRQAILAPVTDVEKEKDTVNSNKNEYKNEGVENKTGGTEILDFQVEKDGTTSAEEQDMSSEMLNENHSREKSCDAGVSRTIIEVKAHQADNNDNAEIEKNEKVEDEGSMKTDNLHNDETRHAGGNHDTADNVIPADSQLEDVQGELLLSLPDAPTAEIIQNPTRHKEGEAKVPLLD
ncbi:hypothetical protein CMQ_6771 [Grosmannia clavigera kw1407]|uniref:Uncharacterized protein n=1 Tax=Grosmannia clavigera (strain kw1407 / UAMH 11150) TaxID=655863 RepID=F0X6J6_GROCL|nr:uncharacterized protein CMQ_6771 [Grosmannia clavigera kw1407]EFX06450.1 hypothetical protein CMQ_6771 [Grosmannia clavigera kw1407]